MKQVKQMVRGGLIALVLCLVVTLTVLVMSEVNQSTLAKTVDQPAVITAVESRTQYIPLRDAPPQRDITAQRFAPLEAAQ
jgi:hypothetical protein